MGISKIGGSPAPPPPPPLNTTVPSMDPQKRVPLFSKTPRILQSEISQAGRGVAMPFAASGGSGETTEKSAQGLGGTDQACILSAKPWGYLLSHEVLNKNDQQPSRQRACFPGHAVAATAFATGHCSQKLSRELS